MKTLRVLIGAGPTREAIDPVRYITNASSGKTGYAVADAAARRGHDVTLVSGPTGLPAPRGTRRIDVESAREMKRAMDDAFADADIVIMAAAVADYRPKKAAKTKIKKTRAAMTIELVPNPDILRGLGRRKGARIIVGFALETTDLLRNAQAKLEKKNLDLIVANGPENLDRDRASVTFLYADGRAEPFNGKKSALGREIIRRAENLLAVQCGVSR